MSVEHKFATAVAIVALVESVSSPRPVDAGSNPVTAECDDRNVSSIFYDKRPYVLRINLVGDQGWGPDWRGNLNNGDVVKSDTAGLAPGTGQLRLNMGNGEYDVRFNSFDGTQVAHLSFKCPGPRLIACILGPGVRFASATPECKPPLTRPLPATTR